MCHVYIHVPAFKSIAIKGWDVSISNVLTLWRSSRYQGKFSQGKVKLVRVN